MKKSKSIKILIVTSSGGHLVKTYLLKSWWEKYERVWVTRSDDLARGLLRREKVCYAHFPENRHMVNFFRNLFLAISVLLKERPTMVFSTGAGIAPPFFIAAKALGIRTVFMETFLFVARPTLSGRFLYKISHAFIVRNKKLLAYYPHAILVGVQL